MFQAHVFKVIGRAALMIERTLRAALMIRRCPFFEKYFFEKIKKIKSVFRKISKKSKKNLLHNLYFLTIFRTRFFEKFRKNKFS
jgi:hypothetical protein